MTERKVLNKYYPPDFDPAKIPKARKKKNQPKEKLFNMRIMIPFNMMCLTCNGYSNKATKVNAQVQEVAGETYLGLKLWQFYVKCWHCCAQIIYRTDLDNNDYVLVSGAKRSFEAQTTAIRAAYREEAAEKEALEKDPIKKLEKSTEDSLNLFRRNSAIQDLMEKNAKLGPQEKMLDDAMEMLRSEREQKRIHDIEKALEEAEEILKAQKQIEAERQKAEEKRLEELKDSFLSTGSEHENVVKLREVIKRKRESEQIQKSEVSKKKLKIDKAVSRQIIIEPEKVSPQNITNKAEDTIPEDTIPEELETEVNILGHCGYGSD